LAFDLPRFLFWILLALERVAVDTAVIASPAAVALREHVLLRMERVVSAFPVMSPSKNQEGKSFEGILTEFQ
jgi:hypothetical protein